MSKKVSQVARHLKVPLLDFRFSLEGQVGNVHKPLVTKSPISRKSDSHLKVKYNQFPSRSSLKLIYMKYFNFLENGITDS